MAQLAGALSCRPKGCGLNPWSGHVRETTDQCLSRSDAILSLPLLLHSLESINISSGEDKNKQCLRN